MKKLLTLILAAGLMLAASAPAFAEVGWTGNIWPVHEYTITENYGGGVYVQIWKEGVTEGGGSGGALSATLYYGPTNSGPWTTVPMVYWGDVGNNDEYRGDIPVSALEGQSEIWFMCGVYDSTDATESFGQDQNNNLPPFKLNITPVLNQDVTVWFSMCLNEANEGGVCITGGHPVITDWGNGVAMVRPCPEYSPDFWQVSVTFPAGSNPYLEYKYKTYDCTNWESGGNHSVTIDDSSPTMIIPWIDHFSWYEGPDCKPCGVGAESTSWGNIKKIYED